MPGHGTRAVARKPIGERMNRRTMGQGAEGAAAGPLDGPRNGLDGESPRAIDIPANRASVSRHHFEEKAASESPYGAAVGGGVRHRMLRHAGTRAAAPVAPVGQARYC